jgi:hypothetical protein
MEFLPKVVHKQDNNGILKHNIVNEARTIDFSKVKINIGDKHDDTYYHFCKFVQHIISCDCSAVTVSGEVLFNTYNSDMPLLELINAQVVRDQLIKDIHGNLFVYFFRSNKPRTMKIYMFPEDSCWTYTIEYNPEANALAIYV